MLRDSALYKFTTVTDIDIDVIGRGGRRRGGKWVE